MARSRTGQMGRLVPLHCPVIKHKGFYGELPLSLLCGESCKNGEREGVAKRWSPNGPLKTKGTDTQVGLQGKLRVMGVHVVLRWEREAIPFFQEGIDLGALLQLFSCSAKSRYYLDHRTKGKRLIFSSSEMNVGGGY